MKRIVCGQRYSGHFNSVARTLLSIVLLVVFSCSARVVFAEYKSVQFNDGEALQLDVEEATAIDTLEYQTPDWTIELRGNPTPEVVGRVRGGEFCLRIAYGKPGAMFTNVGGSPIRFQGGTAGAGASCKADVLIQPSFEVNVVVPVETRRALQLQPNSTIVTRVLLEFPGGQNDIVAFGDFRWRLEARDSDGQWRLIGGLNLSEGNFNSSGWSKVPNTSNRFQLTLLADIGVGTGVQESSRADGTQASSVNSNSTTMPIEVQYGVKDGLEAPDAALKADDLVWNAWEKSPLIKQLAVSWDSALAAPVSMQLCSDSDCSVVLKTLPTDKNPIVIERRSIESQEKVYLIVEWGPTDEARVASGEPAEVVSIALLPVVAYGSYERPLTSCVGRLSGGNGELVPFNLRLGQQRITADQLPDSLQSESIVNVSFDSARGGDNCPLAGMVIPPTTLAELQSGSAGQPVVYRLNAEQGLFVGYLQFNGLDYRSVLARWRESIDSYNALYQRGRQNKDWLDGLVYVAAERGGVKPQIEPGSNFTTSLGDESALLEAAKSMQGRTRVSSDLFAAQLDELRAEVGQAKVTLVYFDDFPGGCGDYISDIAQSGLQIERALIISAVDGYTGADDSLRSIGNGLAHLCEDNGAVRAYAFNWRERLLNLDWDRTLAAIIDDWYP